MASPSVNMAVPGSASPDLEVYDPVLELIGQSLFEVIEEKNRTLNKVCGCMADAKPNSVIS